MFNVGGGELLIILFVALVVLGPEKLPEYARKMGNLMGEVKRMSNGFQDELKAAMDSPKNAAQSVSDTVKGTVATSSIPAPDGGESTEAPAAPERATDDDIRPIDPTGDRAAPRPLDRTDDPAA
jgi:sec-independent protein translocase protein TatB